jgi:hypothetical protein
MNLSVADAVKTDAGKMHSSAMLSSPRKPSSTMRIFASTPCCLRVLRLMSRLIFSDDDGRPVGLCFISIPQVRMNKNSPLNWTYVCSIGADGIHIDVCLLLDAGFYIIVTQSQHSIGEKVMLVGVWVIA